MDERTVQSRVREMAMVLSSAALKSLDFVGKCRRVMGRSWWFRLPSERFRGFSAVIVLSKVGTADLAVFGAGAVERLYRLIRSSELPVARKHFFDSVGGDRARQRTDEAWAVKRKVSEKVTVSFSGWEGPFLSNDFAAMLACIP